jgi:hypothetical protein
VISRRDAEALFTRILLDKVREDKFPSATQMTLIEESIPREMVQEYLEILLEKVQADRFPSIPMLRRMQRVAEAL